MTKHKNQDEEKFLIVVYSKYDSNNRKYINVGGKKGRTLASIDIITSRCTKDNFYKLLLENNVINNDQTEFVIWFKQGDVIKQLPVIFDCEKIKMYAEYLEGNNDEAHTLEYDTLNGNTFSKFMHELDIDSDKYDKLSNEDKNNFMNLDSTSARYCRYEFAKTDSKEKVKGRILGPYQYKDGEKTRIKNKATLNRNFYGIKDEMLASYRSFREKYLILYLDNDKNYDKLYKDLSIEDVKNGTAILPIHEIEKNIVDKKYTIDDYLYLISDKTYGQEFNDFIYHKTSLPKSIKENTNRLFEIYRTLYGEQNIYLFESEIKNYNSKRPGVINKVINDFYKQKDKNKIK